MPNYDQKAFEDGERDSSRSHDRSSWGDILSDQILGGGSYNPPSGHKDSYDKGWENNQNQK